MGTYDQFKTDQILETQGIILDLGDCGKFKIARAGGANKKFAQKFQAVTKPYRRAIQTETIDADLANKLMRQAYADSVVLGWEGVTGPDGQPLPFSRENVLKVLEDLPSLFDEIRRFAEDAAAFRQQVLAADAGNSVPSSAIS